ncbi:serine hydrolase [Pseudohongiella acticola]|jgi:CubicO group peptidase (beta-lactamase class C family)|uniref:serine hydrolase domain-containing protein n=1 Tax=Pseudohongiella acticola TaxID=1524254 RepID=UPI0030ED5D1E
MKKIIATAIIVFILAIAFANGVTPSYVVNAPGVATGIGAKLLCSSRFVSGLSPEQSFDDLVQYSSILQYLDVSYDDANQEITTSLFGMATKTASYQPGLGCYTEHDGFDERSTADIQPMPVFNSRWPHGTRVETIDAQMQRTLDAMVAEDNNNGLDTRALLVVKDGDIVAESYAQGAGPDTPLLGWSMAKSLTSVMLGNLAYQDQLDVDEQLDFASWSEDNRADIRIRDLLTMTDGLDFSEQYNPGDDATAMLFTEPSASGYAIARPALHAPGTRFNYSSGTANILSRIYFNRTGGTLASSLAEYRAHIAGPLSFQHAVFEPDARGVLVGSSYLYASARDWARLGQMMLQGGVLNGQRIVSEDWVEQSTRPNNSGNHKAYGYQWWLNTGDAAPRWPDLPADAYAAQGNRQQSLTVIPSENVVIVRLGWTSGRYPANERFAEIVGALR